MSKQAPAITNLKYYKNETKKGNATATSAKKSLHYYTYGREEEIERGEWHEPSGRAVSGDEMQQWIEENATANKYTYTAVLSLRDGEMEVEDFLKAMNKQEQFTDYRLIRHQDTTHDHAHVMAFRPKTLTKAEFNEWRRTVGRELEALEQERIAERAREQSQELELEKEAGFELDYF